MLLGVVAIAAAGWFVWSAVSSQPVYGETHGHESDAAHEHAHTHGDGMAHGHQHVGLVGETTHSHSHQHDKHQHDSTSEIPAKEGMTQIGHAHLADDETIQFWARAFVNGGSLEMEFFQSEDGDPVATLPTGSNLYGQILNGTKIETEAKFTLVDEKMTTTLPVDFLLLPNHVVKIPDLKIGDHDLSALVPVEQALKSSE